MGQAATTTKPALQQHSPPKRTRRYLFRSCSALPAFSILKRSASGPARARNKQLGLVGERTPRHNSYPRLRPGRSPARGAPEPPRRIDAELCGLPLMVQWRQTDQRRVVIPLRAHDALQDAGGLLPELGAGGTYQRLWQPTLVTRGLGSCRDPPGICSRFCKSTCSFDPSSATSATFRTSVARATTSAAAASL